MDALRQDLRFALRQLRRSPGYAAVAVLTLALGIGANTAIFSVVDGVLLRPAPFERMDRLMVVWQTDRNSGTTREPASVPDYLDFRERSHTFAAMAAFQAEEATLDPPDEDPIRLPAVEVDDQFAPMVGLRPLLGRTFTAEEATPGGADVVLIGEGLWERLYARDPGAVGRTLELDGVPHTVIGVMPRDADFGLLQVLRAGAYSRGFADRGERADVQLWLPLQENAETSPRETHPIFVLGRLAPGAGREAAQEELSAIAGDLEAAHPVNEARGAHVEPLERVVFGPVRPALYVLLGAVGLVLLIACANVASLLLARGAARAREVAVRTALGAERRHLARQFVVEGLLLALAGGALGAALAVWGTELLLGLAPPDLPRVANVAVDLRVLAATLAVSVAVGLGFGTVPTLQARRLAIEPALREGGRGTASRGHRRTVRDAIVVAQLALAVVLLAGAGLLVRSFLQLRAVDPGFRSAGVLKAEYHLPQTRYPVDFARWPGLTEIHRFDEALLREARSLPGVESAAIAGSHPLDQGFTNSFEVVGREDEAGDWPEISVRRVSPGYFETVDLALRRGRVLRPSDRTDAEPVVLVNESAARRFFSGSDPLGEHLRFWGTDRRVVGVVEDERFQGLASESRPAVYAPLAQVPTVNGAETLLLRTSADPASLAGPARAAIRAVDAQLAVFGVEPLTETVSRSVGQRRFTMLLLGGFALVAVLLAAIGVHGVLSYTVARREPELGVRMALGATGLGIVGLVVSDGMRLAALGLGLGLVGALAATRLLRGLLFGVGATDAVTFGAVAAVLLVVAVLACLAPALRAVRVDPMIALRAE